MYCSYFKTAALFLSLMATVTNLPLSHCAIAIDQSLVLAIAPTSAACPTSGSASSQCRTAAQAARPLSAALNTYGTISLGEIAAVISLMAFESDEFKYQVNVDPGRPGQGTYNMQMASYNLLYAQSIDALKSDVQTITQGLPVDALSDSQLNGVRSLLTADDEYDFGSASWFLTSQCSASIRQGLIENAAGAWEAYITQCVGTTVTDQRQAYYDRAASALGLRS